jgi:hypothetical protein
MQAQRTRLAGRGPRGSLILAAAILAALVLAGPALAGCGSGTPKATGPVRCGTSRTAANTPVYIDVAHGNVACSTALTVERDYTDAIRDGKAAGNGGGSPVHVDGWICQGFTTQQVLKTGEASKCVKSGVELLAILDLHASA